MGQDKITRRTKQEPFVMVYHYMIESDLLTDNEFKLYLLLLKYANSEKQCFPSLNELSKSLNKAKSRVQQLLKGLENKGLLLVERRKSAKGDYTSNLYTILDYKELFIPEQKESLASDTDQSTQQSNLENSYLSNIDDTAKQSRSQYTYHAFTREMLNDIYDFDIMKNDRPELIDLLDSFIEIILETLNSNAEAIRINKQDIPTEAVKSRLMKLRYPHLIYVAEEISKRTEIIKNKRSYIITSLYNSYTTIEVHYTNKVNHDMNN